MVCPACRYMMDDFDRECPRCHGKGITPSPVAPPPLQSTPSTAQAPPDVAFLPDSSSTNGLQIAGGLLLGLGLLCAAYYFMFFDTSVAVPSMSFMGEEFGGGRVNNIGLMAQRQNGILIGIGMAVVGAVLFAIGQNQPQQGLSSPGSDSAAQPVSPEPNRDLALLYIFSALLPIGGIVLCLVNINKPQRAQAAAIGTGIGVVCGALLWMIIAN